MNLTLGKMSRRKQAKPNRLNEDEESELFNGELYHRKDIPRKLSLLLAFPEIDL